MHIELGAPRCVIRTSLAVILLQADLERDLRVSGDTEAIVALRNALDDVEGSALDSIISAFGPLSVPLQLAVSSLRGVRPRKRDE